MANVKVLVTGATGKTGAAVIDGLLANGMPARALARRRDGRSVRGSAAESFEITACRDASLPFDRQSFGNRAKALIRFALTPFYAGYDLDGRNRQMGLPIPPRPTLSVVCAQ